MWRFAHAAEAFDSFTAFEWSRIKHRNSCDQRMINGGFRFNFLVQNVIAYIHIGF